MSNSLDLLLHRHPNIDKNGDVCISILHEPGDDKYGYEKASERWLPVHTVETILISVSSDRQRAPEKLVEIPSHQGPTGTVDQSHRNVPRGLRNSVIRALTFVNFFPVAGDQYVGRSQRRISCQRRRRERLARELQRI